MKDITEWLRHWNYVHEGFFGEWKEWRIQNFKNGVAPIPKVGTPAYYFGQTFPENCMKAWKWKKNGTRKGCASLVPTPGSINGKKIVETKDECSHRFHLPLPPHPPQTNLWIYYWNEQCQCHSGWECILYIDNSQALSWNSWQNESFLCKVSFPLKLLGKTSKKVSKVGMFQPVGFLQWIWV